MRSLVMTALLMMLPLMVSATSDGGTESPFALGVGARELALGGSNLTGSLGASASFWNPSALASVERYTVSGFHGRLFDSDIAYQYFGAVVPTVDFGSFGLGVQRLGISGIEKTNAENVYLGEINDNRMNLYFAYGRKLAGYEIGLALTMEHHSIDDYSATSSPGLNLSVGRLLKPAPEWLESIKITAVGRNLLSPEIQLVDETVAYPIRADLGLTINLVPGMGSEHALAFSTRVSMIDELDTRAAFGGEYSYSDLLHLRGGVRDGKLSFGAGLIYQSIGFDYALVDRDMGSLHMFTVTAWFGKSTGEKRVERLARRETEFNNLMSDRLGEQNRQMVTELANQGKTALEEGDLIQATSSLDRALFLARASGIDTVGIVQLSLEANHRLNEISVMMRYSQYLDSAQVLYSGGNLVASRYFAELALGEQETSTEALGLIDDIEKKLQLTSEREQVIQDGLIAADSMLNYGRVDQAISELTALAMFAPEITGVELALKRAKLEHLKNIALQAVAAKDWIGTEIAVDSALILFPGHQWWQDLQQRVSHERQVVVVEPVPMKLAQKETVSAELLREVKQYYRTAQQEFEKGHLAEAIEGWEKVERLVPDHQAVREYLVKAYRFVGVDLYTQNKLDEAIVAWTKAARLDPDNSEIASYIKRTENEIRKLRELTYEPQ